MVGLGMNQRPIIMKTNFFSKREVAEIPKLLVPGESVIAMISGIYTAGTAVLCVTSKRVLLVDKKMIRLSIEDMRFDSIKEVNYSQQPIMASLQLFYVGRSQQFQFKSWHREDLRELAQLLQQKMFEVSGAQKDDVVQNDLASSDEESSTKEGSEQISEWIGVYGGNKDAEKHLRERTAQWRRARRFTDVLVFATKMGEQVMKLAVQDFAKR